MRRSKCAAQTRRVLRNFTLFGTILVLSPLVQACGSPQPTPEAEMTPGSAGARVVVTVSARISSSAQTTVAPEALAATMAAVPTKPGGVPTPVPTPSAPIFTTPAPHNPNPWVRPTPAPEHIPPPPPTPLPDSPRHVIVNSDGIPSVTNGAKQASIIAIGTVRQVLPARWSTPDGQRPANPWDAANRDTIFTPVMLEVEQYIKGVQPQRVMFIYAPGGTVGQDKVEYVGRHNYTFHEGDRVVIFADENTRNGVRQDGNPLWRLVTHHYTATAGGLWTDGFRTVPLEQLLNEIASALR